MRTLHLRSYGELVDYRDQWESLRQECGGLIYCSFDFTRLWLEVFKQVASPRIILIEDKGEVVGIAPFAASNYRVAGLPIKVLALVGDVEHRLRLSSSAVLFSSERHDVLEAMVKEIKQLDWNKFTANNMQDTVAVREFIDRMGAVGRQEEHLPGKTLKVLLPESGDVSQTFQKKARKNTHYLLNRLEKEKVQVEFKEVGMDGIDAAVNTYARQHINRWQSKGGSMFSYPQNSEFVKRVMEMSLSKHAGFTYELMIDNEVAAQLFGFLEGQSCFWFRLGMDNKFARYSPGWIINYFTLTRLRNKGVKVCNTGLGDEDYKHWLGGNEMLLPGVKVNRGMASLLMRLALSDTFQKLDSRLGVSKRTLNVRSPNN